MISALIQGELIGEPKLRMTSAGKPFATAMVRVSAGAEAVLISVTAFSEGAQAILLRLKAGDSLGASGVMELNLWKDSTGQEHRGWRLTAHQVMTVYEVGKRRKAGAEGEKSEKNDKNDKNGKSDKDMD